MVKCLLSALLITTVARADEGRFLTLTTPLGKTNTVQIPDSAVVEVVTLSPVASGLSGAQLWVLKDDLEFYLNKSEFIQGPCALKLTTKAGWGFCTLRLLSSTTAPDKTIVIPAGQGAAVTLQCSSNLVDWVTTTNGTYANVPSMKFFRIYSEKLP